MAIVGVNVIGTLGSKSVVKGLAMGKKLLKQASVLVEKGDERKAISLLSNNFNETDKYVDLVGYELAELLVKAKLLDSANYYLRYSEKKESSKIDGEIALKRTKIDSLKEQFNIANLTAWKAFDAEDYLTADAQFSKALSIDLGHYEPYLGKAEILFVGGQHEQSIKGFKESLKRYFPTVKEKAHVYEHLAEAFLVERNSMQTIKACDSGLEIDPDNSALLFYKAKAYYYQRLFIEAEEYFTKFIRFNAVHAEAWYYRGACFYYLRKYEEAANSITTSIENDSTQNDAYNLRGRSWYELKEYDKAVHDFDKLSQQFEGNFYAINAKGLCYYAMKEFDSAVVNFEQAVKLSPTASYQFNLINAYIKNNQNEEAVELCLELSEENRSSEKLNILHCQALINMKKYEQAKEWLEGSLKINPYVTEYFDLGQTIYKEIGNTSESKEFKSRSSSYELNPINMDLLF
jgi:tetratricopeptide (TPR) repeat protein